MRWGRDGVGCGMRKGGEGRLPHARMLARSLARPHARTHARTHARRRSIHHAPHHRQRSRRFLQRRHQPRRSQRGCSHQSSHPQSGSVRPRPIAPTMSPPPEARTIRLRQKIALMRSSRCPSAHSAALRSQRLNRAGNPGSNIPWTRVHLAECARSTSVECIGVFGHRGPRQPAHRAACPPWLFNISLRNS